MEGYVPGEQPEGPGWIKLNQNESPYPPSPRVAAAIREELERLARYPVSSSPRVQDAAARLYGVSPARVMVTNGSDEMLRILFQACVEPGEEVVAFSPSYTYYATLAAIQGAQYRLMPFTEDYALPASLDVASARLVFLPNPNAPSGTVYDHAEIERLCAAAQNGLVVLDEAYADFAGVTAIPLLEQHANLFVTRTLSKSYALAGLRVGLGFGGEALMGELDKVRDFYNVDRLAQAGARAALEDQAYFLAQMERVRSTRERLTEALVPLTDRVWPSGANFVLARFRSPPAAEVFGLLRERKILVRHFASPRLDDCLRITIGTDEAVDRLLDALRGICSR